MNKLPFEIWWQRFQHCADAIGLKLDHDTSEYRQWYEQGLSPEEAVDEEAEAVAALVEDFDCDG